MGKKESRFAAWRARLADRLAESSQLFLFGLVVACGVEVAVDWNQTLFEVNVLRDQIRQKGMNYAGLLERAVVEPVLSGDRAALDRLATGLIDDEDAIYVRVVDAHAALLYDRVDEPFDRAYTQRSRRSFRTHYAHWIERDLHGVIDDPEGFKARLGSSRYRDLPQIYNDFMKRALAAFTAPPVLSPLRARIVYQDRLRDDNHRRDDSITWAIAPLLQDTADGSRKVGAVLVAFDMARINSAVRGKYAKGAGMIVFFVAMILLQNIVGRRDKLRLVDLGRRYAAAKRALHQAMPTAGIELTTAGGRIEVDGTIDQAGEVVDGLVWDAVAAPASVELLIANPDGDGIDAAAIGLHVLRLFAARWRSATPPPTTTADPVNELISEVCGLGGATQEIPLSRPIGLLRLRIDPSGAFTAICSDSVLLLKRAGRTIEQLSPARHSTQPPDGIIGPLAVASGGLEATACLLCIVAGQGNREPRIDSAGLAQWLAKQPSAATSTDELASWLRRKYPALADSDLAVIALRRT